MTNEEYLKEINRLESRCSNLQAVVNGDAYNIKRLSEINERLVDACSISEMELETLQGEIEMTYRYYTGFGAKKDLTTTEMLNHILRTVPNYKPTTEEHDLEDMKRICDHYVKALEEITKKNRKAETCRMIALKALGELNNEDHQPELLIEENLKLKIQVEDLESKIVKYSIDKVFPKVHPKMSAVELDNLVACCVPGGNSCDPQEVADSIRSYFEYINHEAY